MFLAIWPWVLFLGLRILYGIRAEKLVLWRIAFSSATIYKRGANGLLLYEDPIAWILQGCPSLSASGTI